MIVNDLAIGKVSINIIILKIKKSLFIECLNAVIEHVIEGLKDEIKYQLDSISVDGGLWDNEEPRCNLKVSLSQLDGVVLFLWHIKDGAEADDETKDVMYTTIYVEKSYYGFDVVEIISESDIDVDAEEFNKILISYLKGEFSIDDMEDD